MQQRFAEVFFLKKLFYIKALFADPPRYKCIQQKLELLKCLWGPVEGSRVFALLLLVC